METDQYITKSHYYQGFAAKINSLSKYAVSDNFSEILALKPQFLVKNTTPSPIKFAMSIICH